MSSKAIWRRFLISLFMAWKISTVSSFLDNEIARHVLVENYSKRSASLIQSVPKSLNNEQFSTFPLMPSPLFISLAKSQMQLLALSVNKVNSICLYLPQENSKTGQLEFMPAIIHPEPDRLFIAGSSSYNKAPALPKRLNRLPGFQNAVSLLPDYPMISSNLPRVGKVEEVMCNPTTKTSALSVPFLQGSRTLGVLLVWSKSIETTFWTDEEKEQIMHAAESLSLALSMDEEKRILTKETKELETRLSDALHQVKSPLQALRTYGKLLQQKLADTDIQKIEGGSPQLLELTKHLIVQSDRAVELLSPFDSIILSLPPTKKPISLESCRESEKPLALDSYNGTKKTQERSLIPWEKRKEIAKQLEYLKENLAKYRSKLGKKDEINENMDSNNEIIEFFPGAIEGEIHSGHENTTANKLEEVFDEQSPTTLDGDTFEIGFIFDALDSLFNGYQIIARDKGIDLKIICSKNIPGVWFRPRAIREAISNILDNAIKYVELGRSNHPKIIATIDALHTHRKGVILRISDNGPGIPLKHKEVIFERGYRGDWTSMIIGSGIGLDISRSLINEMGGEIKLGNSSENGSTFEVILYRDAN